MPHHDPTQSELAWDELLNALRRAGDTIIGPMGATSARERAEGFRNATRVLSVALELILEKGDRARPVFTRWINPHRKLLGDNPGTYYDNARLDPERSYWIRGKRGDPTYLGFCVYGTSETGDRRIVGNIDDSDMQFGDDGSFEIALAAERPSDASNWIELAPDAADVMVRQYFLDPEEQEAATYEIEADPLPAAPAPLTEDELAARLSDVARFVTDTLMVEATVSALAARATPTLLRDGDQYLPKQGEPEGEVIDMKYVAKAMPTPAILYTGSWVNELGDDEVMIVEGTAPRARYWSVQFLTRWMESPDYRYHDVIFTQRNTQLEPDGSFRIVIAHRDPGVPNWLETTGLRSGNIAVRAVKGEGTLDVRFRREKISALGSG
jgi:hypothetical protein